jgi:ABC-type polysaccharide/polyol phosphate export permease
MTAATPAVPSTIEAFREYRGYRELFNNLTLRELRSKYKRSVLGWAWSMINPLANMMVYTIVFRFLLGVKGSSGFHVNNYALFLLCGMLPFSFLTASVMGSMGNLIGNSNLIKKTYFPREFIPASTVASTLVSHCIEMSLLTVTLLFFGDWKAPLFVPGVAILMLLAALFAVGLGLLFSIGNVFFRDIEHFAGIFFFIWQFLTPIVYPLSAVAKHHLTIAGHVIAGTTIIKINPMTDLVGAYRSVLYDGTLPSWTGVLYFALWAFGALWLGQYLFRKYEGRLAEEL